MLVKTVIRYEITRDSFPWLLDLYVDGECVNKHPKLGYHEMYEIKWGAKWGARRIRKHYRKYCKGKTGTIIHTMEVI